MNGLILPTEDEIRRLAYEYFELRGRVHGWDVADWLLAERIGRFYKNYERVIRYPYEQTPKVFLGTKVPRICRFCGRSNQEVSFSNDAHAIPAFLGNQSVFSYYECNQCNNDFSEYLEDDFAKMLHGVRTTVRIKGRKKVPNYKTTQKLTRIDVDGDRLEIKQIVSDPVATIDVDKQSVTFSLETQPFIPLAVYKCLAKIALSVLPESELVYFTHTIAWVRDQNHSNGAENFSKACAYRSMTPGPLPPRYGWVELFRRRHDAIRAPYMILVVVTMNLTFQIYVPLCQKDVQLLGQQLTVPRWPAGINCGFQYGETESKNMDLSSPDPITAPVEVNLRSEHMQRES